MDSCTLQTARWAASERSIAYHVHLPLHRRLAVSQMSTLRWSLGEALGGFRQGGIPAIGLSLQRMTERGLERAIDEVQQSGLLVSTVGWVGGFTGGPCGSWDDAVGKGRLAVWAAAQVGAPAVVVVTGPRRTHTRKHSLRIVVEALKRLGAVAGRQGVKLAVQPMHPVCHRGWTFLHTLDETLSLLDTVDNPWVGLAYSTFHLCHELDLTARIATFVDRIASVHLSDLNGEPANDNDRALPGDGTLPLGAHVGALEAAGFRGLYELDPWGRDLWSRSPHGLIAECRRRFEHLSLPHHLATTLETVEPALWSPLLPAEPPVRIERP
ncbi:MAG: sugar phosphate isomerase/epimerase family protein [Planctomycetaceae bacterium]